MEAPIPQNLPLPRTCTNRPGRTRAISDQALIDGINVVGDAQARKKTIHGMIIEQFLDEHSNGQVVNLSDTNAYAGLTVANPGGKAYDAVTLGRGNMGADIEPEDGDLIAEILLDTRDNVLINLAGMGEKGTTEFVLRFSDAIALMEESSHPMLLGYSHLDQHLPRRRLGGDSLAVKKTHFMVGRLAEKNVRLVNALRGMREVPIEFDRDVKNTIAMLQVDPIQRQQLATRIGGEDGRLITENESVEDCGLAMTGIDYGTYFNPSDRDPRGPYVIVAQQTKSMVGTSPSRGRDINEVTRSFMEKLIAARAARKERDRLAKETSQLDKAVERERTRQIEQRAKEIVSGQTKTPSNVYDMRPARPRAKSSAPSTQFDYVGLNNALHARGIKDAGSRATTARALVGMGLTLGYKVGPSLDAMVQFALAPEVAEIMRKSVAIGRRTRFKVYGGWAIAHALIESAGEAEADVFFAGVTKAARSGSIGLALVQRLQGLTAEERTPHRVADYVLQAWDAHVSGTSIRRFVDNAVLPQAAAPVRRQAA